MAWRRHRPLTTARTVPAVEICSKSRHFCDELRIFSDELPTGPRCRQIAKSIIRVELLAPFIPTQMTVAARVSCDSFRARVTNGCGRVPSAAARFPGGEDVVTVRSTSCCGSMTRALALVIVIALIALPAAASDKSTPTRASTPTVKASMERIVARDVAATPLRKTAAHDDRQGTSAGSSPGFFKTAPGMIALAVMAAGTGYALYSASHDRIHSPGKK